MPEEDGESSHPFNFSTKNKNENKKFEEKARKEINVANFDIYD